MIRLTDQFISTSLTTVCQFNSIKYTCGQNVFFMLSFATLMSVNKKIAYNK